MQTVIIWAFLSCILLKSTMRDGGPTIEGTTRVAVDIGMLVLQKPDECWDAASVFCTENEMENVFYIWHKDTKYFLSDGTSVFTAIYINGDHFCACLFFDFSLNDLPLFMDRPASG